MVTGALAPIVSVVMPVRGTAQFVSAAIESIASQIGVEFELICVDDGIAETTLPLILSLCASNAKVRLAQNDGAGIVDALNLGVSLARGRFIARMDADDIALPGRLATQAAYLDAHEDIGVLGTQALLIDSDSNILGRSHVPVGNHKVSSALQTSCALIHPTIMMRRKLLLEAGGYRRGFDGAEDYELWLRLQSRTKLDNLPQPFLLYRRHGDQVTIRRQFHQARLAALAIVADRLRRTSGQDPLAGLHDPKKWRASFGSIDRAAFHDVLSLTACSLADNGGTLRASGARYLRLACLAATNGSAEVHQRLALACVRTQLHLARSGRWREVFRAIPFDLLHWREKLLMAYVVQASSVWRSKSRIWPENIFSSILSIAERRRLA